MFLVLVQAKSDAFDPVDTGVIGTRIFACSHPSFYIIFSKRFIPSFRINAGLHAPVPALTIQGGAAGLAVICRIRFVTI